MSVFDASINNREDEYGGSLENRSRIIFEIIDGIRSTCGEFSSRHQIIPRKIWNKTRRK